jgi:nitroreductase
MMKPQKEWIAMLKIINTRRSIRTFKPHPLSDNDIHELLEAAMNAPSAINEQAWQFVVMSGKVLEEYLSINRNTPKSAPVAILICQDITAEKATGYSVQDCAAATQNILLAAHAKNLGAVWTTVFPDNVQATRDLLKIPDSVLPFSCVPVGYPAEVKKDASSRFDEKKVHLQTW